MVTARSEPGGDASRPWQSLSTGFERARSREDSLDRLVEWPAERALLGDVTGLAVLDTGCGNGSKIAQLAKEGAKQAVGVDISGNFVPGHPGVELIQADLSDLSCVPGLTGRRFDRILFLQSFGYAKDSVKALQVARSMLTNEGFILLTRTQPIRYAIERPIEAVQPSARNTSPPSHSGSSTATGTPTSRSPSAPTPCLIC